MPRLPGAPAPSFSARSDVNPSFVFDSVGGYFVLVAFAPDDPFRREQMLAKIASEAGLFDARSRVGFVVFRDEAAFLEQPAGRPGLRVLHDPHGEIHRAFEMVDGQGAPSPGWVLIDPSLRVLGSYQPNASEAAFELLRRCPSPDAHAGVPLHAPVLIVPRVFELALCRRLIQLYEEIGGDVSGVMRDVGGRTVGVVSDFKRRRDAAIHDEALRAELRSKISARLLPQIRKAFMFEATRMERYIVACYDAEEGGYFRPHRDNTTLGTAHRQFACSINLNAEDFEGGDLRFPEFGSRTYRPPTGGAVVFSCALLHEATPVTRGVRYAFLPFFYNETAAERRRENLKYLSGDVLDETADARG